jgi:hypothetical protein
MGRYEDLSEHLKQEMRELGLKSYRASKAKWEREQRENKEREATQRKQEQKQPS